jgi:hypothetical protein
MLIDEIERQRVARLMGLFVGWQRLSFGTVFQGLRFEQRGRLACNPMFFD